MTINPDFYVDPEYVYTGSWSNLDHNAISGGRITISTYWANQLLIFIGIFTVFVEGGLWVALSFIAFQVNVRRSRAGPRDTIYHQKQAILRNTSDDRGVGMEYLGLWHPGKAGALGRLQRVAGMTVGALFSFLFFLLFMPFMTAQLAASPGDEVLIHSPNCGWWQDDATVHETTTYSLLTNRTWEAITYTDSCYENTQPSTLCDDHLVSRSLTWTPQQYAACPFASGLCLGGDSAGYAMQTAYLDSNDDFGMNAGPGDRLQIQRYTTCAMLNTTKYAAIVDGDLPGEKLVVFYLGPTNVSDYTTSVSLYANSSKAGYVLSAVTEYASDGGIGPGTFTPIQDIWRSDADVSLIFLANDGILIAGENGPCEDPMFSATQNLAYQGPQDNYYLPDHPMSVMGCIDQYSVYDPVHHHWTNYSSVLDMENEITEAWALTQKQVAALQNLYWASGNVGSIGNIIQGVGADALRAKKYPGIWNGNQNPIPNDQWMIEASYWFEIGLAQLQLLLVGIATGPPDLNAPGLVNFLPQADAVTPSGTNYTDIICGWQKIRDPDFTNFHRAGFVALAVLGCTCIILLPILRRLLLCVMPKGGSRAEWDRYEKLELLGWADMEEKGTANAAVSWGSGGADIEPADIEPAANVDLHPVPAALSQPATTPPQPVTTPPQPAAIPPQPTAQTQNPAVRDVANAPMLPQPQLVPQS